MNIVQISEQLKDVPDQFLMQEIQNPTGSYPSYLVVSELTRRKRMREGAIKQEPTTSVAEDLVGISGTPQAGQSTLGAAQQMMAQQQMPQMSMNVPQMSMNEMGQQMPQMMAGGGLVAFEQGGPIRAQTGLYVQPFQQLTPYEKPAMQPAGSMGELLSNLIPDLDQAERRIDPVTGEPVTLGEWMRRSEQRQVAQSPMSPSAYPPAKGNRQVPLSAIEPSAQQKMAGEPRAGGLGAFKMPAFPTDQYEAAMGMAMPTEAEIAGLRKRAGEEFEQTMPDRTSRLLEDRIIRKTEQLQKDKDMSFNEALFAAGAAILSAPGGGGMKWAGEGLKAFGQTMAEGKKDIRRSQDLIDQANIDLAQAQSLRDQGKLAAADKAENKAFDRFAQGRALAQSDAALALQRFNAQVTAAKAPYEIAESQSKAAYQNAYAKLLASGGAGAATAAAKAGAERPSLAEVEMTRSAIKDRNPKATDAQIEQMLQEYLPNYKPLPVAPPLIRGAGTGGATLPQ